MGVSAVVAVIADTVAAVGTEAVVADVAGAALADAAATAATDAVVAGAVDAGVTGAVDAAAVDAAASAAADAAAAGAGDAAASAAADAAAQAAAEQAAAEAASQAAAQQAAEQAAAQAAADQAAQEAAAQAAQQTAVDNAASGAVTDTAGPVAPGSDAGATSTAAGDTTGATTGGSGDVASVETSPNGDIVNGTQTGANPTEAPTAGSETVTDPTSGNTTTTYDDGSTLTTDANGNVVSSTEATDAGINGAGAGALGSLASMGKTIGGMLGAINPYVAGAGLGLLAPKILGPMLGGNPTATAGNNNGYAGQAAWKWGTAQAPVNPGVNPGWIGQFAAMPHYNTTNPTQSEYFWGNHPYMANVQDLAHYNTVPGAPTEAWGQKTSAVGGTDKFNPTDFVNQYIKNPQWAGVNSGTTPGSNGPVAPAASTAPLTGNFQPGAPWNPNTPVNPNYGATSVITPEEQALLDQQLTATGAVAPVPA